MSYQRVLRLQFGGLHDEGRAELILVTGGAGFIGSFLVEKLAATGVPIVVLDNMDSQVHDEEAAFLSAANVQFIRGDVRDRQTLGELLSRAEVVIHCAAAVGVAQSLYRVQHYIDVNTGGTALLLELLAERKKPVKKLVIYTSMTSYGEGLYSRPSDGMRVRVPIRDDAFVRRHGWEPRCPSTNELLASVPTPEDSELLAENVYALSKRYQEELALSLAKVYNFPVVCLRLFNVYGPRQSLKNPYTGVLAIFLSRLSAGRQPAVYEDGNQTRDFVSVHDVVDATLAAIECAAADGQVINIGSGIPRRIADCARELCRLFGCASPEPQITGEFRKGDIRHCTADISKAQRLLEYAPRVSWDEGLRELTAWAKATRSEDHFLRAEGELRERGLIR